MKTTMMIATLLLLLLALVLVTGLGLAQEPPPGAAPASRASLTGTAFTYQGNLQDTDGPVDGTCDFRFSLYADAGAAEQVGSEQTHGGVTVSQGLFTIPDLDFGPGALTGDARWLAVEVRCPAGSGDYAGLDPLQALTPAPNALALPGLWTQQVRDNVAPNLVGGYSLNQVGDGIWAATIGGGGEDLNRNRVLDNLGTVAGGVGNTAGDGEGTIYDAEAATVGGGIDNTASGAYATVSGGIQNTASYSNATVSGGVHSVASGDGATVGGGGGNRASGVNATISGGGDNTADGEYQPTVGGGYDNRAAASDSTVGGGNGNTAGDWAATIAGGYHNSVQGAAGTVGGGLTNTVSAHAATVPGGEFNEAGGDYAFAAGRRAKADHTGAYVWADSTDADFDSAGDDTFNVRANGGVNFQTGGAPFLVNGSPVGGGSYANVVVVAKSGGDYTGIQAALDSITDAVEANPYLVWVAPGVYTETVTMKEWVDIEGAGENVTKITYGGFDNWNAGTVRGASNAEIRFLTVENTGGDEWAIAFFARDCAPRLTHLTAVASGGNSYSRAIRLENCSSKMNQVSAIASSEDQWSLGVEVTQGSVWMNNVRVRSSGALGASGVSADADATLVNCEIAVAGNGWNWGVTLGEKSLELSDVRISVSGTGTGRTTGVRLSASPGPVTMERVTVVAQGGAETRGVHSDEVAFRLSNSSLTASGASGSNNYAIYNEGDEAVSDSVVVNNSQLSGSAAPIRNDDEFTVTVGATLLDGGAIVTTTGTITCAGVYDENYVFYANTCP